MRLGYGEGQEFVKDSFDFDETDQGLPGIE